MKLVVRVHGEGVVAKNKHSTLLIIYVPFKLILYLIYFCFSFCFRIFMETKVTSVASLDGAGGRAEAQG